MAAKSIHYWTIQRRVVNRFLNNPTIGRGRLDVIAADADHSTQIFKDFDKAVTQETERLYNDPEYFFNDPYSFKHPQY